MDCENCEADIGPVGSHDVVMCTRRYTWHTAGVSISATMAGALARQPMDPHDVLAALDRAEAMMTP